ncbi:NAD-binding protein [Crucibulum laeve]|uniref:NAD-binding protein n=1 Tax=Crucibulum laeve TaxID=68775 RepID=A0A5C3MFC5_9AGAR|nr:NAD-binding protein [Crucibulum laeve]
MSNPKINIFMTGVTGYIGGSILVRFLEHPNIAAFNITALVRSSEKAKKLAEFGVHAIVGSHDDIPLLEKLCSEADVVFSTADSDNLPVAQGTLRGMKQRYKKTGVPPVLIHTSGTGLLTDDAAGMYATDVVYNDADADQIETLPPTALHGDIDTELLKGDKEGYIKLYIVLPGTVYGIASNTLVEAGIQNAYSMQIPDLIKASLDRGQAGMVGKGQNLWPNVHVDELANLYIKLYDSITSDSSVGHGRDGFYFGASGEHKLYDVAKAIGEVLVSLGKSTNPEPTTFTKIELDKYFHLLQGSEYLGTNSRCLPTRSRSIGWNPMKGTQDLLESIEPEVKAIIQRNVGAQPEKRWTMLKEKLEKSVFNM